MDPATLAVGAQFLGGIFGGSKRKKAAAETQRMVIDMADDAVRATEQDRIRAIQYREMDEERLKKATGLRLSRMVREAQAAGFNPLTVLQATGGVGYDRRGEILQTPFVSIGDAMFNRASLAAGTGQAMVETAGYFGDALGGLGDSLLGLSAQDAQRKHEERMLQLELQGRTMPRTVGTSSASFVVPTKMTSSPIQESAPVFGRYPAHRRKGANIGHGPQYSDIEVYAPGGRKMKIDASWARRNGFSPGDRLSPGDWEVYLGESGQGLSVLDSVPVYGSEASGRTGTSGIGWGHLPKDPAQQRKYYGGISYEGWESPFKFSLDGFEGPTPW